MVSLYGPSDVTRSYEASVDAAEVLPMWLGGHVKEERRNHIMASPLYWVTPLSAPTLLLQGTEDPYVYSDHAIWMYQKLRAALVEAKLVMIEGAGHGFRGEDREFAMAELFEFFNAHLKP